MNPVENVAQKNYFRLGIALSITFIATAVALGILSHYSDTTLSSYWHSAQATSLTYAELAGVAFFASSALHFLHAGADTKRTKTLLRAFQIISFIAILGFSGFQALATPLHYLPLAGATAFALPALLYPFLTYIEPDAVTLSHKINEPSTIDEAPPETPAEKIFNELMRDRPLKIDLDTIFTGENSKIPEVDHWMVNAVGPYKAIGSTKMIREIPQHVDNCYHLQENGKYLSYNVQALYDLLKLNEHVISDFELKKAIEENDPAKSAELFIAKINQMPQMLVDVAFGDPRILNYNVNGLEISDQGVTIALPPKGLAELISLKQKFPDHNWNSIRNLLVYFHRENYEDPVKHTEDYLNRLASEENIVYFIENRTIQKADASLFIQ